MWPRAAPFTKSSEISNESVTFLQTRGMVLGLLNHEDLAEDMRPPAEGSGFSGVALAYNVRRKDDLKRVLAEAEQAGASILKPADDTFWGDTRVTSPIWTGTPGKWRGIPVFR